MNLWLMTLKIRVGEIALKASHNFLVAFIHALDMTINITEMLLGAYGKAGNENELKMELKTNAT